MTNRDLARHFKETSALIELTGGNGFRARALAKAGRTLGRLETPAVDLLARGDLATLPGVGKGVVAQVQELAETGTLQLYEDLRAAIPPGLLDVLQIKGLGAKRVRMLWQELGITSLDALEAAAQTGRLEDVSGFGAKTQATVLEQIDLVRRYMEQWHYAQALPPTEAFLETLQAHPTVYRAALSGALRRQCETIETADFLAAGPEAVALAEALSLTVADAPLPEATEAVLTGTLPNGLPLQVYLTIEAHWGTAWWATTSAEAHRTAWNEAYGAPPLTAEEPAFFATQDLPVIPPCLREGRGELAAAAADTLPTLITVEDLQGSLHNHSTYSDGANALADMAERTREMGLHYFGICDHSQSLKVAHGLSVAEVRKQQAEIEHLNAQYEADNLDFRVFSGIESDILPDGSLDYPDDVLASFDFIVASVHVGLSMTEEVATERVLAAVRNPYTTILGHPTGRLLLRREGYPLDYERVLDACAEHRVAVELNAHPLRLDLDWRWIRAATDRGVLISINPDAHTLDGLDDVRWGVAAAQKGWLTPDQCLNAFSLDAFTAWLQARRL
ncbi:MAG: helix-hairpin-helix domain-containing protein [Bacteroidota bacterium]